MAYTQEEITKADGPYSPPAIITEQFIKDCILEIDRFPEVLKTFYQSLNPEQQNATYREGGWTFRQVIHHIADSHMQAFSRFKLTLTEEQPIIKPYIQNAWAETFDSHNSDAALSVDLLFPLHKRWVALMQHMTLSDFNRIYIHPEYGKEYSLGIAAGLYAWHGHHHYTQMQRFAANQGWVKETNLQH